MVIKKQDVKTFTYHGTDEMIKFNVKKIPPVHKDFKGTLKLKDGREVKATGKWLGRIWNWWYQARKDEIETSCLVTVSNQLGRS